MTKEVPLLPLKEVVEGARRASEASLRLLPPGTPLTAAVKDALIHWACGEPIPDFEIKPLCFEVFDIAKALSSSPRPPLGISHADLRWAFALYSLRIIRALGNASYGKEVSECHETANRLLSDLMKVTLRLKDTKRPCLLDQVLPVMAFFAKHEDYEPFSALLRQPPAKLRKSRMISRQKDDFPLQRRKSRGRTPASDPPAWFKGRIRPW